MSAMSQFFRESGIYFTYELSDGRPWEAIIDGSGDLWGFDGGIIPREFMEIYNKVPSSFAIKNNGDNLFIINKDIWGEEPWLSP